MPRGFSSRGSGFDLSVDTRPLSNLARDLKGTDLRKDLLKRVRKAAEPAERAVKAESAWSSRIPGAVRKRVTYGARGAVAKVEVDAAKAPHAAALNNRDQEGTFRHPTWGSDTWVSQQARPFMKRAADSSRNEVIREVTRVFDDVARAAGYR